MPRRYGSKRYASKRKRSSRYGSKSGYWGQGGKTVAQLARTAYNGVKYIKGLVNSEMYKFDFSSAGTNLTDSWAVVNCTSIAQGDGDGARTGNSVLLKNVNIRGAVARSTSGDVVQTCKIVLLRDKQQIADTVPTGLDVFEAATPWAHLNSDTVGRFDILWSKVFQLDTVKTLGNIIEINVPMQSHVRYNGTAAADFQKGGIYMMFVSTQSIANYPVFKYECRVSYHDN